MIRLVIGSLLALSTVNAVAGNITYIADDGSTRITHVTDTIEEFYGDDKRAMLAAENRKRLEESATIILQIFKTNRRLKSSTVGKSETVFRNGSSVDVGAKMGMSTNQVLTKTYWGEPDYINTTTDEFGKLEQWVYGSQVKYLVFDNDKLVGVGQFISYLD